MKEPRYRALEPITRVEAIALLRKGKPKVVPRVLFRLAWHEPDWAWVRGLCLDYLSSPDSFIRYAAAECLSDLARSCPDSSWWVHVPRIRDHLGDNDTSVVNAIRGAIEFIEKFSPLER